MIALVIDPAVVGSDPVGHVEAHEIPAYLPTGAPPPFDPPALHRSAP